MPRPKGDYVYSNEELLDFIRNFYEEHDRIPRYREFDMISGIPSAVTISKRFGGWNKAIKKAGFTANDRTYSKAELLRQIKMFYKKTGKVPTTYDLEKETFELEMPSLKAYYNRFDSWEDVLKAANLEKENNAKTDAENLSETLQEYYYSGRYSPNSLRVNLAVLVDFETFLIKERNKQGFSELELRDVIEYFQHLETKGVYDSKRKCDQKVNSINTLINKAIVIAGFLSWDEDIFYKENHPIVPIGVNKEIKEFFRNNYNRKHGKETTRRALTPEQTRIIFRKVKHPILRFVVWLGLNFALRCSEYLRLKLNHVDLANQKIKIYGKYKGRGHKERILDLTKDQIRRLKREIKRRNLFDTQHDYLITTKQGNEPYRRFLDECYREISEIVGFKITAHDIRYTCAKRWEKAESKDGTKLLLSDIQRMLGHSNLVVTSRYLRVGKQELKQRYNKVLNNNKNEYW